MPNKPKRPKAGRIGDLTRVPNTNRNFGSSDEYWFLRVQFPDGREESLLVTDAFVETGIKRAKANPEDLLKAGVIQNLLD